MPPEEPYADHLVRPATVDTIRDTQFLGSLIPKYGRVYDGKLALAPSLLRAYRQYVSESPVARHHEVISLRQVRAGIQLLDNEGKILTTFGRGQHMESPQTERTTSMILALGAAMDGDPDMTPEDADSTKHITVRRLQTRGGKNVDTYSMTEPQAHQLYRDLGTMLLKPQTVGEKVKGFFSALSQRATGKPAAFNASR